MTIFITIIVLSVLIIIHESGHYLTSKIYGVRVFEFAVGFGKKIWGIKRFNTLFSLRLIPIGGFVRIAGIDMLEKEIETCKEEEIFEKKSFVAKIIILASGSFFNLFSAIILFFFLFVIIGEPMGIGNRIIKVSPNSPASLMSLEKNDRIIKINDQNINKGNDIIRLVQASEGKKITLTYIRDEKTYSTWIYPVMHQTEKNYYLGIRLGPLKIEKYSFFKGMSKSLQETINVVLLTLDTLAKLLSGKMGIDQLSGPIGIVSITGQMVNYGLAFFIKFIAILSVNLAVLNLLPIPALDGGRITILFLRKIFHLKSSYEQRFHLIGMLFLLGLMMIITFIDINKLFMR